MAFTVEDGTAKNDANAYIDTTYFNAHHADRGVDTGFGGGEVQQHIIRASDYVDKRFGRRFRGFRRTSDQGLEWPRIDAFTDDDYTFNGVPEQMKKAIAEYTLISLHLGRNLAPMPPADFPIQDPVTGEVTNDSAGKIVAKGEEVGPIKESTTYADGTQTNKPMTGSGNTTQNIPEYPQADMWIEEIIDPYNSRSLSRG